MRKQVLHYVNLTVEVILQVTYSTTRKLLESRARCPTDLHLSIINSYGGQMLS
jgi:hypothetical protein